MQLDIDRFIKEANFFHVIQPIVDFSTQHIFGYEFLIRSNAVTNQERLFQQAKQQKKLFALDIASIYTVFEQTIQYDVDYFEGRQLFINVFPSTLTHPMFLKYIHQLTEGFHVDSGKIVIEINESEPAIDIPTLKKVTTILKEQGFIIALDDLGKGEATLQLTVDIRPDIAKIDRYFAHQLSHSAQKQKMIKGLVNMLSDDTAIVLEGIETEEDMQTAISLGVQLGQGYYLGKPEPVRHYVNQQRI